MKKILFFIGFSLYFLLPFSCYGNELYSTVYCEGKNPIIIDGDLSDWDALDISSVPLPFFQSKTQVQTAPASEDFSAVFKSFADVDYVYIAVLVNDDKVIIGNHPFSEGWYDDSIEICYDGDLKNVSKPFYDSNDGQIRIVPNPNGIPYVEGNIPYLYIASIPYYWEARGVRCGFKLQEKGYTVEVAIPLEVLEMANIHQNSSFGLNVMVLEDDNEGNDGLGEGYLSWSYDPDDTSWWKTECYNRIVFSRIIPQPVVNSENPEQKVRAIGNNAWEIELGLNAPDSKGYNALLASVLNDFSNNDWSAAEEKIKPISDRLWAQLFLGVIQMQNNKFEEGIQRFHDFSILSTEKIIKEWASLYPYTVAKELMMSNELFERFQKRENWKSARILHEYLKLNPDDKEACELLTFALQMTGGSEPDLYTIQKIILEPSNNDIGDQAQVALARYYYINNQFENANSICNNILTKQISPQIALDSRMILLSVEKKSVLK